MPIGFHFQQPVPDWPRAVAQLPAGAAIKAIDNVQMLAEAKANNAHVRTIMRHHYDGVGTGGQHFNGSQDWQDYEQAAREFFASFIDGTFLEGSTAGWRHTAAVDFIEEWNEYLANGMSGSEYGTRLAWCEAACRVWNEYRQQPDLAHIRLVICNTAIGNDIPLPFADLAHRWGAVVGYHPYVPVGEGNRQNAVAMEAAPELAPVTSMAQARELGLQYWPSSAEYQSPAASFAVEPYGLDILPGEWNYYSGRWATMDWHYQQAGLFVDWLFTESGPVGYGLNANGDVFLRAVDGWRSAVVYGGDVEQYIANIGYWYDNASATPAWQQGRVLGSTLFTSANMPGGVWNTFETLQPELDQIASWAATYVPPGGPPDPPPPDPEPEPRRYARTVHLLPQEATTQQAADVLAMGHGDRQSLVYSADDAFITPPELTSRTVYVYDVAAIAGSVANLEEWIETHYPPVPVIEYRELPSRRFRWPWKR